LKLVTGILQERIIPPSKTPFYFSIILVEKKGGSLWACIDCKTLNAIIIKDCFLIPRVDEIIV